jgi:NlpC/P60 family putative phage cell wall peptidase
MTIRQTITGEARSWIGTPYHHQAALEGVGCGCLGLVYGVWRGVYGGDPEHRAAFSRDCAETLREETLADAAGRHMISLALDSFEPGDHLLFAINDNAPAKHCAILVAADRMIHAIESHPVAEISLVPWWHNRLRFVFRFSEIRSAVAVLLLAAAVTALTAGASAVVQIAAAAAARGAAVEE